MRVLAGIFFAISTCVGATTILEAPAFQECELKAFVALTAARNVMHLNATKESLLTGENIGDYQRKMADDLFKYIEQSGSKDHGEFASNQLYDCAKSKELSLPTVEGLARTCLKRHDIIFFLGVQRQCVLSAQEAVIEVKSGLTSRSSATYPAELIELLGPAVYGFPDDEFKLRKLVFESCFLPDDWRRLHNTKKDSPR